MRKISMMVIALLAAVTMSATVVTMDFTSSDDLSAMGVSDVPATGKNWNLAGNSLAKGGVTLTGDKGTASTDNRIYNSSGNLSFRTYKNGTITFTVTGSDLIKGLIFNGTVSFEGVEDGKIATNAASVTLTCTTNSTIKSVKVYVNENLPSTSVDTISVSEARARIDKGEKQACFIKGVVAGAPLLLSDKYYTVWLTDINNPSDSIQAYKMRPGKEATGYKSLEEMAAHYGLHDTVLIKAEGLDFYAKASVYETTSGYYVETLGKSSAINANEVFKYAIGARQWGKAYDNKKYKYELIFSKLSDQDVENALHMIINTADSLGIEGSYTIKNYQTDSSYVDGEGPVTGSAKLTYVDNDGVYNKYKVAADFIVGDVMYRLDTTVNLCGWTNDYQEQFTLEDDTPFEPNDGDTLTCKQALRYAKSLGEASTMTLWVRGFATGFQTIQSRTQQCVYMADSKSATSGIFMGFWCYTQNLDSIIKGDEVLVKGKISYYSAKSVAQISNGDIYRIGGSDTKRPRNPQIEARPAGAITVAQAIAIGQALQAAEGQTVETTEEYTVAGFIVDVNRQMSKDTATWYMADTKGEYGEFEAYKCQIKSLICEDDEVYVTGKISKYQKSAEVANIEIKAGKAGFLGIPGSVNQVAEAAKKAGNGKVMINGQLYIRQGDKLYNALGTIVK